MKRAKLSNKLIVFIVLITMAIFTMGASSWLIITENQGTPSIGIAGGGEGPESQPTEITPEVSLVTTSAVYESENLQVTSNLPGTFKQGSNVIGIVLEDYINTTVSISAPKSVSGDSATGISTTVTFTPNQTYLDNNNYTLSTTDPITITPLIKPVVAISNSGTMYYSSINHAIDSSVSGDTIYIYETFANYSKNKSFAPLTITEERVIKSGVTLTVPKVAAGIAASNIKDTKTCLTNNTGKFADTAESSNLIYNLSIGANAMLTNNGTINIAGEITGGSGGSKYASFVCGKYGQITLFGSAVINNNATINAYGYIKESSTNNSSNIVNQSGGLLNVIATVLEHRGGSAFTSLYGGLFGSGFESMPFNHFFIQNCSAKLTMNYGAKFMGFMCFQMSSMANNAEIPLVGNSTTQFVQLQNSNAKVDFKYIGNEIAEWDIYGNFKLNTLKLTLLSKPIETAEILFPITWNYNYKLHKGTDGSNATVTMVQNVKIMPGGSFIIDEGVTVNAQDIIVYADGFIGSEFNESGKFHYINKANKPAELLVNGKLTVNNLGGKVTTSNSSAQLTINSSTSVTTKEIKGSSYTGEFSYSANGNLYNAENNPNALSVGTYYSYNSAWYTAGTKNITYNTNGGSSVASHNFTVAQNAPYSLTADNLSIALSTRNYYTLEGWYYDSALTQKAKIGDVQYESVTLYAKWTPKTYEIKYNSDYGEAPSSYRFEYNSTIGGSVLPTLIDSSGAFTFAGWYATSDYTGNAIGNYNEALLYADVNNVVTLYAKWTSDIIYNVTYKSAQYVTANKKVQYTLEEFSSMLTVQDLIQVNPQDYNDNSKYQEEYKYYYGGGWVAEGTTTVISELTTDLFDSNNNLTLEVYWIEKVQVNVTLTITDAASKQDGTYPAIYKAKVEGDTGDLTAQNYTSSGSDSFTYYLIPGRTLIITYTGQGGKEASEEYIVLGNEQNQHPIPITSYCDNTNKSCVTADTLVTLADGTKVEIQNVVENDMILVFNHETGEYVPANILFLERGEWQNHNVINLEFDNGTVTKLIYEHALFDTTLNKYVYITEDNYQEFVGHKFAITGDNFQGYKEIELTKAYITVEYTAAYSITSLYHYNFFINDMFSIPGAIEGLFNIFEYGEGLKYDEEKMQADIEKYGLAGFEHYSDYMSYEMYSIWFPAKYYSVAVGKGVITYEEIRALFEYYFESFVPEEA